MNVYTKLEYFFLQNIYTEASISQIMGFGMAGFTLLFLLVNLCSSVMKNSAGDPGLSGVWTLRTISHTIDSHIFI